MSLNGNLEAFPLEEVLRLLARSQKTGCLRVDASGLEGKVYLEDGRLVYATTRSDEDLRADLLNARLVEESSWPDVESRSKTIAQVLAPDVDEDALTDFVREAVTEVLFRIRRPSRGTFDFASDVQPRYSTGRSIDVEVCIVESDRRIAQWREIEEVIPGMNFRLRMVANLHGDREITISPDTWRHLAALEGEGTVSQMAERLGTSEFKVAQAMATLVRARLVELVDQLPGAARYGYGTPIFQAGEPDHIVQRSAPEPVGDGAPLVGEGESGDQSYLQDVLSQIGDDEEQDDRSPPVAEEVREENEEQEARPSIGLLRRRGLGALARELTDGD